MRIAVAVLLLAFCGCGAERPRPDGAPTDPPSTTAGSTMRSDPGPWDPRRVDDLPAAPEDVAPALPAVLTPPRSAPSLADRPVAAAVLSVDTRDAVLLLATDGSWRSVPSPDEFGGADLTSDGTRLAVEQDDGVVVWDVPTGARTFIANPAGFAAWDFTSWRWLDDSTLLLKDGSQGGWRVAVPSGTAEQVQYPQHGGDYAFDAIGSVVEAAGWGHPKALVDWAGGEARKIDMRAIGRLDHLLVGSDIVVGTTYDNGPFEVVVADRSDLALRSALRIRDVEGNYSPGLRPVALRDEGTVLLVVPVFGKDFSWRVVCWEPTTGDLSLVTRGTGTVTSYAAALLR